MLINGRDNLLPSKVLFSSTNERTSDCPHHHTSFQREINPSRHHLMIHFSALICHQQQQKKVEKAPKTEKELEREKKEQELEEEFPQLVRLRGLDVSLLRHELEEEFKTSTLNSIKNQGRLRERERRNPVTERPLHAERIARVYARGVCEQQSVMVGEVLEVPARRLGHRTPLWNFVQYRRFLPAA